ncbi:MAG TPA: M50 family metallopeptidase [Candidatus Acidoferrales bacterium]|nr:M50 family metallopeptidase [Candidatus Acidoferrales bacterium]
MSDFRKGSLRLFRWCGINVYLHWSWFLVAAWEIGDRGHAYSSVYWNEVEYLALFLIVTIHEFGHALACRQVGGTADQIVLWPLGGLAYVNPPQRPGATLWSVTAGPLVNVALLPVFTLLTMLSGSLGWATAMPNLATLLRNLWLINLVLLIFNMLPIYPLDGGQILRSLLWFPLGRARSLMAASIIGFVGTFGLLALAWWMQSVWIALIGAFVVMNCWTGFQRARALSRFEKLPRHDGFACPDCKVAPPVGNYWICNRCKNAFDTFQTRAVCPSCAAQFDVTRCLDCGKLRPLNQWIVTTAPGIG